ncbi:MAG: cytochrome c3 family protein [Gemmataceae bacterium]
MNGRIVTLFLLVGVAFGVVALMPKLQSYHLPGNQQGYEPEQPIAFSHRLHAGELQISCVYCHGGAETGRHAGFPATSVCMNCHKSVTASSGELAADPKAVSAELRKLYDWYGLDENRARVAEKAQPIPWVRVHSLPDFAYFDHRAHIHAGVECKKCHGPVETMERVTQVESLSMGWCVNCHRDANRHGIPGKKAGAARKVNASLDCAACHF